MNFFDIFKNLNFGRGFDLIIALSFIFCFMFLVIPLQNNIMLALFSFFVLFVSLAAKLLIERGAGYVHEYKYCWAFAIPLFIAGFICFCAGIYKLLQSL
ncbi:MAG: hypothetical protein LBP40_04055 [Campylobacteraceae bacterium]|nr:hypothetical protein [Campylobacteraceae bacterium]